MAGAKHPRLNVGPSASFPPVLGRAPRVLILGTMPGQRSLDEQQYYAHPRNSFWWIMEQAFGLDHRAPYADRIHELQKLPVALWDVLASCVRPGSLDSDIQRNSEIPNNISCLLVSNPSVVTVLCNGQAAATLFRRHILPTLAYDVKARIELRAMPSTSPAYAAMGRDEKAAQWLAALNEAGVLGA